jgi:hypothetical protein
MFKNSRKLLKAVSSLFQPKTTVNSSSLSSLMTDPYEAEHLLKDIDIHSVTGLLKMYLRELPEALFTSQLYKKFFEAFSKCFVWCLTEGLGRSQKLPFWWLSLLTSKLICCRNGREKRKIERESSSWNDSSLRYSHSISDCFSFSLVSVIHSIETKKIFHRRRTKKRSTWLSSPNFQPWIKTPLISLLIIWQSKLLCQF